METNPCSNPVIDVQIPKRVSREAKPDLTKVTVGRSEFGGETVVVIAGPCAVESREQLFKTAAGVSKAGAGVLRGGAFKPRSSPYNFQGMGEEGLKLLSLVRAATGLPIVTEVMDTRKVELVAEYADMIQIGSKYAKLPSAEGGRLVP